MSNAPVVEICGLDKTFRIAKRKKIRNIDTNTISAFISMVRQSFRGKRKQIKKDGSVRLLHALSDINLEVRSGEVLGIIGRNGAGKSTLLKTLAKVIDPSKGSIKITGRVVSLLELGIGFDPHLTVRENIYLNGQLSGMAVRDIKAAESDILEFAELSDYADDPLIRCPGGSFVRLAFATMMGVDSDIILADEVLAVGDTKFRKNCEARIRNVAKTGEAVLFVSHDMEAIKRCCTRVVWIDHGKIRQIGDTNNVVDAYVSDLFESSVGKDSPFTGALEESGRIVDLCLASEPGKPIGALQLNADAYLESLVRLEAAGVAARLRLEVRLEKSVVFIVTSPWTKSSQGAANYSLAVRLPAHFFNEAKYVAHATLELTEGGKQVVEASLPFDPLEFQVMNTDNTDSVWAGWNWSRPGLVSPRINWTTSIDPS